MVRVTERLCAELSGRAEYIRKTTNPHILKLRLMCRSRLARDSSWCNVVGATWNLSVQQILVTLRLQLPQTLYRNSFRNSSAQSFALGSTSIETSTGGEVSGENGCSSGVRFEGPSSFQSSPDVSGGVESSNVTDHKTKSKTNLLACCDHNPALKSGL